MTVPTDTSARDTLKLSDAMRLGAMLGPQVFGKLRSVVAVKLPNGDTTIDEGTCAIGAVLEATGFEENSRQLVERWPWILNLVACPACGDDASHSDVLATIVQLNDSHLWTRERIADWLDTTFEQPATTVAVDRHDHATDAQATSQPSALAGVSV